MIDEIIMSNKDFEKNGFEVTCSKCGGKIIEMKIAAQGIAIATAADVVNITDVSMGCKNCKQERKIYSK